MGAAGVAAEEGEAGEFEGTPMTNAPRVPSACFGNSAMERLAPKA